MQLKEFQTKYSPYLVLLLIFLLSIIVVLFNKANQQSTNPFSRAALNSTPTPTPTPPIATIEAENGTITVPFVISAPTPPIYIYQPNPNPTVDPTQGGRASYTFTIPPIASITPIPPSMERFIVKAVVDAQEPNATSALYINIDGEPTDSTMLWDIPATSGFQTRIASWRGLNTPGYNKFAPKAFSLAPGLHTLIVRGQQGNVKVDKFIIEEYACLADVNQDGTVTISDYSSIMTQFGTCQSSPYDLNGDGCINIRDINIYKASIGFTCRKNLPIPTVTPTRPPPPSPTPTASQPTPTPIAVLPSPICAPNEQQYWSDPPPGSINCPIFTADNYWNRTITDLPVTSISSQQITRMSNIGSPPGKAFVGFGSGLYSNGLYGIPYNVVPTNQPLVPMSFVYSGESDPGPYPYPTGVGIQDMPNNSGDRHAIVIQNGSCNIYETFATQHSGNGYAAGSGAKWDMDDPNQPLRHDGWTSADAAGLPVFPGLIRYDEVWAAMQQSGGMIHHALRFVTDDNIIRANSYPTPYIWPARHSGDGSLSAPDSLPFGLRLRLKSNVNIETGSWSPQMKVILRTLRNYGMILADGTIGAAIGFDGVPDCRWNDPGMWNNGDPATGDNYAMNQEFLNLQASMFEVVDTSGIIVDPNSGRTH